MVYRARY
jgi:hypothetical protein